MRYPYLILVLILFILLTSACTLFKDPDANILWQDDFSNTDSGWDVYSGDRGSNGYLNGQYQILVEHTNFDVWARANRDFGNVTIEVEATKSNGSDDNNYGLICKYEAINRFYMFLISSDGYYVIQKMTEEGYQRLSSDWFEASEAINKGNTTNKIKADCLEGKLALHVNGTLVSEVLDSDFSRGDVGLLGGTYNQGGVEILFDNFIVRSAD